MKESFEWKKTKIQECDKKVRECNEKDREVKVKGGNEKGIRWRTIPTAGLSMNLHQIKVDYFNPGFLYSENKTIHFGGTSLCQERL